MDALRQWGFSLCAAAMACSLIRTLFPHSSLTKTLRIALSVFFLTVLIQPFGAVELTGEIAAQASSGMEEAERIAETLDMALTEGIADEIENEVHRILGELGIAQDRAAVSLLRTEEGLQLKIRLSPEVALEVEKVRNRVEEEISLPAEVSKEENDGTDE